MDWDVNGSVLVQLHGGVRTRAVNEKVNSEPKSLMRREDGIGTEYVYRTSPGLLKT